MNLKFRHSGHSPYNWPKLSWLKHEVIVLSVCKITKCCCEQLFLVESVFCKADANSKLFPNVSIQSSTDIPVCTVRRLKLHIINPPPKPP